MSTFTITLATTIVSILNTITLSLTKKLIYQDNVYYLK